MKIIISILVFLSMSVSWGMGGKPKPSPTPTPSPTPSTFTGSVWLASNITTPDFLSLFSQPELWAQARTKITGLQFYAGMIHGDGSVCQSCGPNTFEGMMSVGAFDRMKEWNIEISIEAASVKSWDCDATANIDLATQFMDRLASAKTKPNYISMDEPFYAGVNYCPSRSAELTADAVARYIKSSQNYSRKVFGGFTTAIGLIEPYPGLSMDQILSYVDMLTARGASPAFINLDFDFWAARNMGMSDAKVAQDLKRLQQKCRDLGINFGMLYWGHDGNSSANFRKDVLELTQKVKNTLGRPDRAVVQSWSKNAANQGVIPPNLTDTNPQSLTGLLLSVLGLL